VEVYPSLTDCDHLRVGCVFFEKGEGVVGYRTACIKRVDSDRTPNGTMMLLSYRDGTPR
jgi:hypothetical protein